MTFAATKTLLRRRRLAPVRRGAVADDDTKDDDVAWQPASVPGRRDRDDVCRDNALVLSGGGGAVGGGAGEADEGVRENSGAADELGRDHDGQCRGLVSGVEAEQVVATNGGASCDKAPLKIQEYVGYRSVNDPLFKADKLMLRAVPLLPDDADVDAYLDAVNTWAEKAQMSSLNAYTSSWGEANPNGSKGQVNAFLEDAKFDVEESAKVLKNILTMLQLPLKSSSA
eukprot:CAMPEP_0198669656 /NCGR_PEP_ID=MMETSP1467-20131203/76903_1 /TAXON_ID=1462469 /ORGANISM="unid. sp., Strain CCMP2135" /LENGTH=226 /DNA_ID=CAMNT_0044406411 /DNA_START=8 /DNA_END=689 /DNA_ORIENTATION=-